MVLVPFSYNMRSLLVRRSATLLTVLSIGATVAVLAGVLALQQGFAKLFTEGGSDDLIVILRKGSNSEGESMFPRERVNTLIKSVPGIATNAAGLPMASGESYLAVRRFKQGGGETNVPIRGVQPMTFELVGDTLPIIEGRRFRPGTDEVIVGSKLPGRIRDCRLDDVVVLNTTPFRVVGVFDHDGPFSSEIWGDVERMAEALKRRGFNRVIARLSPEVSVAGFIERLASHEQVASKAMTEHDYFSSQTEALSIVLIGLGGFLAVIMGVAAVFTATTTMLAALAARTHEIGILKSIGFRPVSIFLSFLFEALLLGLMGGVVGCLMTLPINGMETGTMNFSTFTEVAFAFRVTPQVLVTAVIFAVVLGLFGGAWPAWRAARRSPVDAWRRR